MIVLHGTWGGPNPNGVIQTLKLQKHIAVHYIIDGYGKIYQLFDESYYAFHAGQNFRSISKQSIGIEICNWLNLKLINGKYYNWTHKPGKLNGLIDSSDVIVTQEWRQNKYWHKIKQSQYDSMCFLLNKICDEHNINKKFYRQYNPSFYKTSDFNGILMHSSFHPTRLDFEPSVIPKIVL